MNTEPDAELCCPPLVQGALDEDAALELAGILKALADPVRLRLVSLIASSATGEVCACDLPALLDRSQPTMSHHLSQLVKAGLVEREQRGKWAWFRLRPQRLEALGAVLGGTPLAHSERRARPAARTLQPARKAKTGV
jgi:ArsR family transcriptional regulator, arsenate/arsenite/antimonite-responsive transcriptional repressor